MSSHIVIDGNEFSLKEHYKMSCKNPDQPAICLCPLEGAGYGVRQVLANKFINGWLDGGSVRLANRLAADVTASEFRLWEMLFNLEEEASGAMEMWRSSL